jgi:hypothetical protein
MFRLSLGINNAARFLLNNMFLTIFFGSLYYAVQFIDDIGFVVDSDIRKLDKIDENNGLISLKRCMHFSLVSQTTLGYGGVMPAGPLTLFVNTAQMISIFVTSAIELL